MPPRKSARLAQAADEPPAPAPQQQQKRKREDDSDDEESKRMKPDDEAFSPQDNDSEEEFQPRRGRARAQRAQLMKKDDLSVTGAGLQETRSDLLIHRDRKLSYKERVHNAFRDLKLYDRSVAPLPDTTRSHVHALFDPPASIQKKEWHLRRGMKKGKVLISDASRVWILIGKASTTGDDKVTLEVQRKRTKDDQTSVQFTVNAPKHVGFAGSNILQEQVGIYLENFMNNWPHAVPTSQAVRRMIADAALAKAAPSSLELYAPVWNTADGWKMSIKYFDEDSGTNEALKVMRYKGMNLSPALPQIPNHVNFITQLQSEPGRPWKTLDKSTEGGKTTWSSMLPSDLTKSTVWKKNKTSPPKDLGPLKDTEHFLKFLQFKLHGMIAGKEKLRRLVQHYERMYTTTVAKATTKGYVRLGTGLYRLGHDKKKRLFNIWAGGFLQKELGAKRAQIPHVSLRHHDLAWFVPVFEAGNRVFVDTGDAAEVWLATAEMVDDLNEQIRQGLPPPGRCSCTGNMKSDICHPCGKCLRLILCLNRRRNQDGVWVCETCFQQTAQDTPLVKMKVAASTLR